MIKRVQNDVKAVSSRPSFLSSRPVFNSKLESDHESEIGKWMDNRLGLKCKNSQEKCEEDVLIHKVLPRNPTPHFLGVT